MRFSRTKIAAGALLLALSVLGAGVPAHAATTNGACTNVQLSVALAAGQATDQTIAGELCTPTTWVNGAHQVDVTTPGATYSHTYFDWQNPSSYSYVAKTLQAGRAILDYDRIGTGASSHPLSTLVTTQSDAYVLHQIIQWLRTNQGYGQVNSIGHSYGSVIAVAEAGLYTDTNRVVLSGYSHAPNPGYVFLSTFFYPASLDPRTGAPLGSGYLTTIPNTRQVLYAPATTDPAVLAYDNAHPDTVSATSFATALALNQGLPGVNVSNHVTAPVLIINGEADAVFCGSLEILNCADHTAVKNYESPYFTSVASLSADSVPATGHDLALSTTADQSFDKINSWLQQH